MTSKFLFIAEFTLVSSGANCEASGYQTVTSEAECKAAVATIKALGRNVKVEGTVESTIFPSDCYLRGDGPLWYNTQQSTKHCDQWSTCVCISTSAPQPSSGKSDTKDSSK